MACVLGLVLGLCFADKLLVSGARDPAPIWAPRVSRLWRCEPRPGPSLEGSVHVPPPRLGDSRWTLPTLLLRVPLCLACQRSPAVPPWPRVGTSLCLCTARGPTSLAEPPGRSCPLGLWVGLRPGLRDRPVIPEVLPSLGHAPGRLREGGDSPAAALVPGRPDHRQPAHHRRGQPGGSGRRGEGGPWEGPLCPLPGGREPVLTGNLQVLDS